MKTEFNLSEKIKFAYNVKEFIKRLKEEIGDNRDSDGLGYYTYDFIHSKIDKLAGEKLI